EGFGRVANRLAGRIAPVAATTPRVALACDDGATAPTGMSPAEQVATAEGALRIMGLTTGFAPVVVLCGHGGQAVNNPFAAGLDCGACGGNRGGPNARIMAEILNDAEVRRGLAARGIAIPTETVFLAAEHNTTTDEVTIWNAGQAASQGTILARLQADLATARAAATEERLARLPGDAAADPVAAAERRAADWAQVRPEWALARNAAFIVADRGFTKRLDLEGRCFLHSYDWRADADGAALEVILTAPMVVAEWINTQYYFSTVDNAVFGAGSKVTHNVVGGFGVMQGNASDLMTGLPAQSVESADGLPYHEPLRLMTVVRAPRARVEALITKHRILQTLFGNGWVALLVADPETGQFLRRNRDGSWRDAETGEATEARRYALVPA
ncbi:putative inorganic carbon transporter subunit DabA, partial [Falsiroseomonas oryzae]|uniref:putative inorganic carbon transporter subunit DabA n=1 Tax=Falsiroseomonas oryzae TaxID=2766473 RepID=UPI0022EB403C